MKRLLLLSLVSFAFFFADSQALQLQHPILGDVWPAFSTQKIQWQFANVDNIKIEISTDSARTWSVLQFSYPATATFYNWTVVNKPSDSCYVRISDVANPSVQSSNYPGNPFKIPKPTVSLDNVAASVYGKTAFPITWTSIGTQTVRLFASYNNRQSFNLIADNIPAVNGYYNWIAKDTATANCYIMLQSVDLPSVTDTSDNSFSIVQLPAINAVKYHGGSYDGHSSATNKLKSIHVVTPNTKVQLTSNTTYPIAWNSTSVNQVNIKYSIDSGANWLPIVSEFSATVFTYNWPVPATPSVRCLVKISDASDSTVFDINDSVFTIKANTIKFSTPVEKEVYYKGQVMPISWTSQGVSKVNITYLDGSVLKTVQSGVSATNEVFNWVIPASISDSIKIKIADFDNALLVDSISKVYLKTSPALTTAKYKGGSYDGHSSASNKAASLTIITPNGNNQLASARPYNITWKSTAVANIDLAFSSDSGRTWQNIITAYSNIQDYVWTVPGIASAKCLIRIRSSQDSTINDISDSVFSILPKNISLVTDTAAIRYIGTAMPLEWTQQGIEKVSLNYKTTKTGSWQKIKDSLTSTLEVYNWVLPVLNTDSVWVRIFDYKDSLVKDEHLFAKVFKNLPAITSAKFKGGSFDGHSFRSTNNKINIYKPAANDTLKSGSTYPISWTYGNVTDSINLQYSLDSGITWKSISTTIGISSQYNWIVPDGDVQNANNIVSNKCVIRAVEMNSVNEIVGVSNKTFSILQSGTLPVTIISFTGKYISEGIALKWIVENEANVSRYEIERSFDGESFIKIGEVKAENLGSYAFTDKTEDIKGRKAFYRLKKAENNVHYSYSSVLSFKIPVSISFTIYPNPAKTYVQIRLSSNVTGLVKVQITDVSGKVVQLKTIREGTANIRLNTDNLSSGTYIITITNNGESYVKKFIVANRSF